MLVAVVLATAAAGFYLTRQSTQYTSAATVQLAVPTQQAAAVTQPNPNLQLVTGDAVSKQAAITLHASDPAKLAGEIQATYDPTISVVTISATVGAENAAAPTANAFANGYIGALKAASQTEIAQLNSQVKKFSDEITALQKQVTAKPNDAALRSKLASTEGLYQQYQTQLSQAQLAPEPATMLVAATGATATSKSTIKVLALGIVIGLIAGIGIALMREQFDRRVRTEEDVEAASGHTVLTRIPYVRSFRRGTSDLPVVDEARSPFAEAVRELRTAAAVLLRSEQTPVLVVTSPAPLDGKSLVAANLAASWALSGARVVLVDGDLRRPRAHEFFATREAAKGLAEILSSRSSLAEETENLLVDTHVEGLRFLPAGYPHGDPADGLASTAMDAVLDQLRASADIVIVDAPPVLAVADAIIIAERAAGAILVVRSGKTQKGELAESVKRLHSGDVTVLGAALNRAKVVVGAAYGDYYRSGDRKPELQLDDLSSTGSPAAPETDPVAAEPEPHPAVAPRPLLATPTAAPPLLEPEPEAALEPESASVPEPVVEATMAIEPEPAAQADPDPEITPAPPPSPEADSRPRPRPRPLLAPNEQAARSTQTPRPRPRPQPRD